MNQISKSTIWFYWKKTRVIVTHLGAYIIFQVVNYVNIEGNHQSLKFIIWKMMWSRLLKVGGYPVKLVFISYLIAQRRNMGHWQGYSYTHMMLITVLYLFNIKFSKSPVTRLDCKIWLLASAGFELGTLDPELTCYFIVPLSTKPVKLDN